MAPNNQVMPSGKEVACAFPGFQSVTIIDSASYDAQFAANCWVDPAKKTNIRPNCSRPVVALNCSGCTIDGLTIIGATSGTPNAVRLHNTNPANPADGDTGKVVSGTFLNGHQGGSYDAVDDASSPVGNWATKNLGGGFTVVSDAYPTSAAAKLSGDSTHAMLIGNSGERSGRLAIDGDGALRWGDGGENDTLDTSLLRPIHKTVAWDPPPLGVGASASVVVPVGSKPHCRITSEQRPSCNPFQHHLLFYGQPEPGDPVSVGAAEVMLSAQVSASYPEDDEKLSEVKVLVRNVGDAAVDLANGTLRVVVTKWE